MWDALSALRPSVKYDPKDSIKLLRLKYPHMFRAANIVLINKIDLAPHVDFDEALCRSNIQEVNPNIRILSLSAKTGDGMSQWIELLQAELSGFGDNLMN